MPISFDGPGKRVNIGAGQTSLSVRDLWSAWVAWVGLSDNSKYAPAMSSIGGDSIDASTGTIIPIYAFLENGWRVKPQEASHTLSVNDGVLLVSGGGDPFVNTTGDFVVRINYQQPVQAISFSTGGAAPVDANAIAQAVWEKLLTGAQVPGSAGSMVQDAATRVAGIQ